MTAEVLRARQAAEAAKSHAYNVEVLCNQLKQRIEKLERDYAALAAHHRSLVGHVRRLVGSERVETPAGGE